MGPLSRPLQPVAPASSRAPASDGPSVSAQKTAREFEAVFLGQMMQIMMESMPADGEFGGGHGEQMFRGVLAEKLGTAVAARGGIGLAPAVLDQIIKLQGGNQ